MSVSTDVTVVRACACRLSWSRLSARGVGSPLVHVDDVSLTALARADRRSRNVRYDGRSRGARRFDLTLL